MPSNLPVIEPHKPGFQSLRNIGALMLREMGSTYGKSPGGYLWALIEPMGTVLLLSVLFSFIIKTPSLGISFILFYATGYLPFNLYSNISGKLLKSLQYSKPLLAYPRVVWIEAMIARTVLNCLTGITVFIFLISGILIVQETQTELTMAPLVIGLTGTICIATSVGCMNCLIRSLFPIWDRIWAIIHRPIFLASCIFYIYEDLPETAQTLLWWNPLAHTSGMIREGFFPTYHPEYVSLPFVFGTSLCVLAFALIMLRRHYPSALAR